MDITYLLALEITAILGVLKIFSLDLGLFIAIFLILGVFLTLKKNICVILIPAIFLFQAFATFNNSVEVGEVHSFQIFYHDNFGKIEKIGDKTPLKPMYTKLDRTSEGRYKVLGSVENIYKNYYDLEVLKKESLSPNKIQKYFDGKSENILKNLSYDLKRNYQALILGKSYKLTKEMREKYNYVGISHMMALSGFHIGLIIFFIAYFTKFLPLKKRGRNVVILIFLTFYYLGINSSPSLNRAYIMGVIYLLGNILYEDTELFKTLLVSYIISLIINPNAIFTISFQLSYGAIFIISEVYPHIRKLYESKSKTLHILILDLCIQILFTPLFIYYFGYIHIFSALTNIILTPFITVFIFLGYMSLLLENFALGGILSLPLELSFKAFSKMVDLLYKLPFLAIKFESKSSIIPYFYAIIILVFIIIRIRKDCRQDEKIFKRTKISQ